jgi:dimethylhistidine N-methyltransferase
MALRSAAAGRQMSLHDLHLEPGDFRGEVLEGLGREPKTLPCKYFYDDRGSRLFDRICQLEEYYPTRTEIGILERHAADIAARMGERALVVELGSGSSIKTQILLAALRDPAGYVPVDIAREHLRAAAGRIAGAFPELAVQPVCTDFSGEFSLPPALGGEHRRFVFFPGSTIGNFDSRGRLALLRRAARICGTEDGGMLIGIDLVKDVGRLEAAYNDARGVTAAFNLNLLHRINRELEANFESTRFRHHAFYDAAQERIEMHLVSELDQIVSIGSRIFRFRRGESICTEHSYKFSIPSFAELARCAGLELDRVWTDDEGFFAVLLLVPADATTRD